MSLFPTEVKPQAKAKRRAPDSFFARRSTWVAALLIAVVTIIAFHRVVEHPFLDWDDSHNFFENPKFNPVTLDSIAYYWAHPLADLYIPVTYTVWGVLAFIAEDASNGGVGLDPHVFHTASLLFHIAAAIGVLLVLRRLGLRPWPAAFGALIFSVHPLQTEAVAWASGLKDVLAAGLCIWASWFYLAAAELTPLTSRSWKNYLIATLLFLLAMFSKPQAVCLPLIILAVEALRRPKAWRAWALHLLPWLAITIPVILIGRANQPAVEQATATPLIDRPLVALDDLVFYGEKLIFPADLTVDYAHSTQRLLQHRPRIAQWLVPLMVLIFACVFFRRARWLAVGIAIFVCALLPVLGFLPFDFQMYSNVTDHYVYLAMLGPALIGASAIQVAIDRGMFKFAAGAVGVVLMSLMAVATFLQANYWSDNFTLFNRNLQLQPDSFVANVQVGTYYSKRGDLNKALALYRHGLTIKPRDAETRFDVGNALSREGRYAQAEAEYRLALEVWPKRADLHTNLGIALVNEGKIDDAMDELRTADQLQRGNPKVLMELGVLSLQRSDVATAKQYFSAAVASDPDFTPARAMLQQIEQSKQPK